MQAPNPRTLLSWILHPIQAHRLCLLQASMAATGMIIVTQHLISITRANRATKTVNNTQKKLNQFFLRHTLCSGSYGHLCVFILFKQVMSLLSVSYT